ncbi:MAG: methylenetetrahydrofolate--tRNA-(uracil(54)-C(5))-methyltransferase (FADH(2)-oxidizing) TrmFO [Thermodesulfobacteriota bacterium]
MSSAGNVTVIGAGLAGSEATYYLAKHGIKVKLFEMRPRVFTPAHNTSLFGELVCSNSLKSSSLINASGVLKEEMKKLGSIVMEAAEMTKVPAGQALAVDREKFSDYLTKKLRQNHLIEIIIDEVKEIPPTNEGPVIIATGPLTSNHLAKRILQLTESENLYFYDAISPIIDAESIDFSKTFKGSRYGKGSDEEGDYLNCSLNEQEYDKFVDEIINAPKVEIRDFEKEIYFEGCLPIEILAQRGKDSLRFGPMKPVGLIDPRTKKRPYSVIQLRKENNSSSMYSMVGFQTKLTYAEQRRVLRLIPGLENAEFLRYGSVHRNTFINSPKVLLPSLQIKGNEKIMLAGQIVGVEGYVESAAMGLLAGINALRIVKGLKTVIPPHETAIGSLIRYITDPSTKEFQPMNINFGLFPKAEIGKTKSERRKLIAERAISKLCEFNQNCKLC